MFRLSSGVGLSYTRNPFTSGDTSRLIYANINGIEFGEYLVGIESEKEPLTPSQYLMVNNFPNPFNPSTTVRYRLPHTSDVQMEFYDMNGKMIRSHSVHNQALGWNYYAWDGKNTQGENVGAGIYFCSVLAGDLSRTIKMVLIK